MPVIQHVKRWVIMGKDKNVINIVKNTERTALLFSNFDGNVVK